MKFLGINLTKVTKNLYAENYKIWTKEIKDDTNRWRYTYSWIGRIKFVKVNTLPKQSTMQSLAYHQWHFSRN